jgi:hypothetical protein
MFCTYVFKCFYLDVAMCCNVFQVFHVFSISVSDACFNRFIGLQTYVASVV